MRDIHQVDLHDYQPSLIKKKEKKLDEGNENCKINKSQHLNVASFTSKPQLDIVGNQSNKLHVSVEVAQFKPQAFLKCNQNVSIPISNTNRKTPFKCEKCHLVYIT